MYHQKIPFWGTVDPFQENHDVFSTAEREQFPIKVLQTGINKYANEE
jgi:hypothetical protein